MEASEEMNALAGILRCPVCKGQLDMSAEVKCHGCGRQFLKAGGYPVLIDFDDSIFTPEDYRATAGAVIPRLQKGTRIGRFLNRLTYGTNKAAAHNIGAFLNHVRGRAHEPVILVVGGGSIGAGMRELYQGHGVKVVGVDVYASPNIEIICDGHSLPFSDESFEGVVIQAVLEHVLDPRRVVDEIHRVLKPAGLVYAETPFMQQVHEKAYDFTRFTLGGHRWLFRKFEEIDAGPVSGPGVALLWSISYFVKSFWDSDKFAAIVAALFFWLRLLERRAKRGPALDSASGIFFLGSKSDNSLKANELPAYYLRHQLNAV
jgi:SAM-dependent methyltransferase